MLLALDLDGTLLDSRKQLSARNLEAITRAQDAGTTIVLASGRHPYSMSRFADMLHLNERGGYVLAFNGGQLIDYATDQLLFHEELPRHLLPRLVEWAHRYDLPILSFRGNVIITEKPSNHYVVENAANNRMPIEGVVDFIEALDDLYTPPTKFLLPGNPNLLPEVEAAMKADLQGEMEIYRSAPHYLELVPLGIDKGRTLQRLKAHLAETTGAIVPKLIACGDQDNDISMIRTADIGVAMGNAEQQVKAAADYVAPTNDEDGVAHVIERFILHET